MDPGAIVNRQHIGIDIDDHFQLGAAQDHRFRAVLLQIGDDRLEFTLGLTAGLAEQQFIVDDPVECLNEAHFRGQQFDIAGNQFLPVKTFQHDIAGADQRGLFDPVRRHPRRDAFGDVDYRDRDCCGDLVIDLVHRIGPDQDRAGPGPFQPPGTVGQHQCSMGPFLS